MKSTKAGGRRSRGPGPWIARLFWLGLICWLISSARSGFHFTDGIWRWLNTRSLDGLPVLCRTTWKAGPVKGVPEKMAPPRRITVHHSAGKAFDDPSADAAAKVIRAIQQDHQQRGWCDIGYHFIIDRGGRVWEGRPTSQMGAHAGSPSMNQANLGIVVLGNFDLQAPAKAQLATLECLLGVLCRRHGIRRTEVCGHGEVRRKEGAGVTECPGRQLAAWVEDFRRGRKRAAGGARSVLSAAAVKP
jgi:hypothetical protein